MAVDETRYRELAASVDEATQFLSGGHSRTPEYQDIAQHGINLLPYLVSDLHEGEFWVWRTQLVCEIAQNALSQSIYFDPETRGKSAPVKQRIADWWTANGQQAFEAAQSSSLPA